jgi:hypothetical protein
MYGGISYGLLNMTCDVYVQKQSQDPNTGGIIRDWVFSKKIICHIDIITSTGAATPDNFKDFGFMYVEEEKIRLKTKDQLSKRFRITNIKNRSGEVVFSEKDKIDSPPTIFEIDSHHPRLDPLGNILYHESNLRRVGVQDAPNYS